MPRLARSTAHGAIALAIRPSQPTLRCAIVCPRVHFPRDVAFSQVSSLHHRPPAKPGRHRGPPEDIRVTALCEFSPVMRHRVQPLLIQCACCRSFQSCADGAISGVFTPLRPMMVELRDSQGWCLSTSSLPCSRYGCYFGSGFPALSARGAFCDFKLLHRHCVLGSS